MVCTLEEFQDLINRERAILFYFSNLSCNVGESLQPKIENLLRKDFPKISFVFVDINLCTELSAHCQVFVEPTILVYFDGKETIRKSRNFGLLELQTNVSRIYEIAFEE